MKKSCKQAFTLIELSIVLVIIGLIIGGALVGRDLIDASAIRSQLSQIEQYNVATKTFRIKYNNFLPGDISDPTASGFGFKARGAFVGQGDGDGRILAKNGPTGIGNIQSVGEPALFWVDLSTANLIGGNFNTANATTLPVSTVTTSSTPNIDAYLPQAKIGNGNYLYAWHPYYSGATQAPSFDANANYCGLSVATSLDSTANGKLYSSKGLTTQQATAMDSKIDDGMPYSGIVQAVYLNLDPRYLDGANAYYASPYTFPISPSATTCTDNRGVAGTQKYSTSINTGLNCALSFKFQ